MITAFEYDILTEQHFSNPYDFDWLIEQNFDGFSIQRNKQQWQIKFSHYVGVIGLPSGEQLEILPKIGKNAQILPTRQWLQQMLMAIWQTLTPKPLPNIAYQNYIVNQNCTIYDWLQAIFWQQFQRYQPNQQYQRHEQNQAFLQGKLLIKQQIQHNHYQPHKFFQQNEQFIHDTAGNRLVKTTILQLFGRQSLNNLTNIWQNVATISRQDYQTIFYQAKQELHALPSMIARQNGDFLDFCFAILNLQQASQYGQFATPTLWINMQFAFEKWIFYQIKQQFNTENVVIIEQKNQSLTADNRLIMKPDIWLKSENTVIVMDVKWKMIDNISQIKLADMYQLLTYAEQFEANEAWLIVPTLDKNQSKQQIQLAKPKSFQVFFVPFLLI